MGFSVVYLIKIQNKVKKMDKMGFSAILENLRKGRMEKKKFIIYFVFYGI